ncbi:MAG: hypothetical protein LBB40_01595 [Holophagales bacterium]|jgi:hypothetical protein|nr:hypothetical protein [Holophagales bacterium]
MKIRFIYSYEQRQDNQKTLYKANETHDLDDETAKKLIKEGIAEPFRKPETAPTA